MRSFVLKTNLLFSSGEGGSGLIPNRCNGGSSDASAGVEVAAKVDAVAPLIP